MKSRVAASHVSYSLSRYRASATLLAAMSLPGASAPSAFATNSYWDSNGAAGFTSIAGTWNGINSFWNTDINGATSGTFIASPTSPDDLFVNGGKTGTMAMTGTQSASNFSFGANVATTLSGGTSLTICSNGTQSGVFVSSNSTSTLSTPLILNSTRTAFSFSNSGTGLLTIGGNVTGAVTSGTQTITAGSSNSGGITFSNIIADGSGGKVAFTLNRSNATAVTTLNGAITYTGATTITAGKLTVGGTGRLSSSSSVAVNNAVAGALTINAGGIVGGNVTAAPSASAAPPSPLTIALPMSGRPTIGRTHSPTPSTWTTARWPSPPPSPSPPLTPLSPVSVPSALPSIAATAPSAALPDPICRFHPLTS